MERLDKILANTGRWSRKEARELVRAGRVAVDGVTAQAADGKYDPAARFEVDGETVSGERLVYLMPPFVIRDNELEALARGLLKVISEVE